MSKGFNFSFLIMCLHNLLMNKIWPSMQVEWLKTPWFTWIYHIGAWVLAYQDHQIAQLILARFNWFNLPTKGPVNWLLFRPTPRPGLHEFSRENTAHVQVLGVGFEGFVVAQNLCGACRRHRRNQEGIAQAMLCLGKGAGRDWFNENPIKNLRLKEKRHNFSWGSLVLLEMLCPTWDFQLKVVHCHSPPV